MPDNGRIRTPWIHKWRRFRYSVLPLLCFIACAAVTAWLWQRQGTISNAVASGDSVNIAIRATADGTLHENSIAWNRFEYVSRGDLIAKLNGEQLVREVAALRAEVAELEGELEAERVRLGQEAEAWTERVERWKMSLVDAARDADKEMRDWAEAEIDRVDRLHDIQRELRDLNWEVEKLELDLVDRKAEIQESQGELRVLANRVAYLAKYEGIISPGTTVPLVTPEQVQVAKLERDVVQTRITVSEAARKAAESMRDEAKTLRDKYKKEWYDTLATDKPEQQPIARGDVITYKPDMTLFGPAAVERILAPIHSAIVAKKAEAEALEVQQAALDIHSPVDGMVFEVFALPGQYVCDGDPIVTITAERPDCIVSYVRQAQGLVPKIKMEVAVRRRAPGSPIVIGHVVEVGPRYEAVPRHQLRDPNIDEWGRPVRIEVKGFRVEPGELVDITFLKTTKELDETKKGSG